MSHIEKAVRSVQGVNRLSAPSLSETINLTGGGVFFAYMDSKPLYKQIKGQSIKIPKISDLNKFVYGVMLKKSLRLRLPESLRRYLESRD